MFNSEVEPENSDNFHFTLVNNLQMQNYCCSLQRSSNISSKMLLNDIWESNKQLGNKTLEHILNSSHKWAHSSDVNLGTWKSMLKNADPVTLFENSIDDCVTCCANSSVYTGIENLNKYECKCELNSSESIRKTNSQMKTCGMFVKSLVSGGTSQATKSDEQRHISRPSMGFHRGVKGPLYVQKGSRTAPDNNYESIEENKVQKAGKAKVIFKTAKEQLIASNPAAKRTLGTSRKAQTKFISPMIGPQDKQDEQTPEITDERLKHIDPKMIELIESEIIDKGTPIGWEDIAGLEQVKSVIQEAVVWPLLRPDIFTGLRRPPKGILLFGPPGTGKTLIGKCVASQCGATFFCISASSLTSKWLGDGEKMVRALFAVARTHQPAVIFIDEIDSLLTQRSDSEHEATRRIKTEFLVQFDGAATGEDDRLLVVGATNRPHELDEAARRRLVKRLYVPLPDAQARAQMISLLLRRERHGLSGADVRAVGERAGGLSGADVRALCAEAAMGPVRAVPLAQIASIHKEQVRPVSLQDFEDALQRVRPSVSPDDLGQYVKWNQTFGQGF